MSKVQEVLAKLYANKTVYRLVWTTIQVGSGLAAAQLSNSATVGFTVTLLTTVLTSLAREKLGQ